MKTENLISEQELLLSLRVKSYLRIGFVGQLNGAMGKLISIIDRLIHYQFDMSIRWTDVRYKNLVQKCFVPMLKRFRDVNESWLEHRTEHYWRAFPRQQWTKENEKD